MGVAAISPDSPRLAVLQRIWLGFLGGTGYRRLDQDPRGVYAAFLLVAASTAAAVATISALAAAHLLRAVAQAWHHLPAFTIEAGHLLLPAGVSTPVRAAAGSVLIVLAMPSQAHLRLLGIAPIGVLISPVSITLRSLDGAVRTLPLQALGPGPVTKASLGELLSQLAGPGVWMASAISLIYQVARDFVRAAVVAWVGLTFARLGGATPTWPQAWRVGLAAWTLPLAAEVLQAWVAFPSWALWLVACIYAVSGCYQFTPAAGDGGGD